MTTTGKTPDGPPVVSGEDVSIEYGDRNRARFLAVDGVTFQIHPGERFVIIGPSGCGKTTLLMAMAGFLRPLRGTLSSSGHPITGPGPDRAVVFQDFDQLFPWRTILGNLTYALQVTGRAKGQEATRIAEQFLEMVRIGDAAHRYPHQLSGGMKQRAAIARALAIEPSVLLMDEPFGAVDEITRTALQRELDRISRATQVTLVMVTHSIQEAAYLGDRVMVMAANPGRVRAIVDTSGVSDLDSPGFAEAVTQLRTLLEGRPATDPAIEQETRVAVGGQP
ncbi:ABC transporter ATP-binding protein [Blastococcus saxobsidens]|uniref:Taurine transporter subunit ATP-binding component of ABC superfamily n=1 Tax=Blastococcus saxobsidens (strain DD2) TaxID=1146883 RepID=H6RNS5_BLASD|nr:ABC transporter ATP-binding protein [Blastococcus saxobsidens]CCG05223.1 taurine transporter subunit; ATP-binding component of ABC superfamily [Blastococcus saxobsidens DD2]